jgi:hypothetical protein
LHGCLAIVHSLLNLGAVPLPPLIPSPPLFLELSAKASIEKIMLLPVTHAVIDRAASLRWLKPGAKLLADLASLKLHLATEAGNAKKEANADATAARSAAIKAKSLAAKKGDVAVKADEDCCAQRLIIQSADTAAIAAETAALAAEEIARKKPTPTNMQKAATATKLAAEARSAHRQETRALKPLEEKAGSARKAYGDAVSNAEKAESAAIAEEEKAAMAEALEIRAISEANTAAQDRGPSWSWYDDNGRNFGYATKVASENCRVSYGALNDRQRYCFIQVLKSLLQSRS